eukprot:gene6193-biopygen8774
MLQHAVPVLPRLVPPAREGGQLGQHGADGADRRARHAVAPVVDRGDHLLDVRQHLVPGEARGRGEADAAHARDERPQQQRQDGRHAGTEGVAREDDAHPGGVQLQQRREQL